MKHVAFGGRLVILGFGSIGQGVLPLILRHIDMPADRITIVTGDDRGKAVAEAFGVRFVVQPITPDNYADTLGALVGAGDFLLNLSVDVSSVALIVFCQARGALYLDTCVEPWAGGYTDTSLTPSQRSNYALRESALAIAGGAGPTAVLTHGANPGLVSHFVKQALLNLARDTDVRTTIPATRAGWAALARELGVKVIHIAERDTQTASFAKKPGEFVNTWSIDGFVGEGCQPAELGWGSHEAALPADGRRHDFGCGAAIYLMRPGASTRVRTWTPAAGPIHGFLITHNESISIADYYTVRDGDTVAYRPTVHYAYHPCDDAVLSVHELAGRNWEIQPKQRLMMDEIRSGVDELGVLLMGHARGTYWYGSRLSIEQARTAAPYNNATSLQVTAAVLGGMVWAIRNPKAGVVEADHVDHETVLTVAEPYLGDMIGAYSDWTPLEGRGRLFPEDIDMADPWQFKNFRVV
ncbi:MAG TPA: saccharopine dehydrogenase C-terminal domain-containing protein [Rhodopila sp.]|uniref:homospermidine synthase n=1 Tax=Rhodopila sp. TaxID=2480087 RepID=UPI002C8AD92A|nr:saccharopine dehydrogenase C-terminal domain-containing protein [Rhodopila sp.]HVY15068.1 saccharopine dehydrogenase C-terminal domain-containing protein [Rhodopila sp.]